MSYHISVHKDHYLFFFNGKEKGWYIGKVVWQDEQGFKSAEAVDGTIVAWLGYGKYPEKIHLPYSDKKPLKGATIVTYSQMCNDRI